MREPKIGTRTRSRDGSTDDYPFPRPVAGGKALARVRYFQAQRGVEPTDAAPAATSETTRGSAGGAPQASFRQTGLLSPPERLNRSIADPAAPAFAGGAAPAQRSLYLNAFRQVATSQPMFAPSAAGAVPRGWQPLGPHSIPHGQTYGTGPGSRPPVAGRISAIAVDPLDGDHILIGAASGGIWESRDRGESWQPRADDQPSLSIGALAFDPSDPSVVYAGTGEGDTFSWLGVGLLRSLDGGATWSLHAENPFQGRSFFDLLVDPRDGQHLLAGTSHGLFESADGGTTWALRRSALTWSLSLQPADPNDPAAVRELFAGCEDGLCISTDGGTTWSAVALPGPSGPPERVEVCHAPSDRGVAYVVAAGPRPTVPALLWRRNTAAGNFSPISPPSQINTAQASYDWFAAVSPGNANVLYVGAIDAYRGELSGGSWSWSSLTARSGSATSAHPDQHAIAFGPNDPERVYLGNDGGLYASDDGGTTWRSLNEGLSITEFEFLADHAASDAWILGGTQDNGTLRYQGHGQWYHVQDGDGGDCGVRDDDPYVCFHTFYGMGMERSTQAGAWGSWQFVGPHVPASEDYRFPDPGALFYPPVEVRNELVVQAGRSAWINSQGGDPGSWEQVPLPAGAGLASSLAIASADRIYLATHRGRVFRIDRGSGSWLAPVALASPTAGFLSDLLIDPADPDRLWVTCSQLPGNPAAQPGVYRSDDAGASWTAMNTGLPDIPINSIAVDPTSPDTVFVAADVGVHRSFDAGQSWAPFSEGLPNCLIKDLLFHPPTRLLRAATRSRGVWEISVDQSMMPDVEIFLRDSVADTGRRTPSPSGVDDPFVPGQRANWWQCSDLKLDSPTFVTADLADVDSLLFGDDESLIHDHHEFAEGPRNEVARRGTTARLYLQVHNRGSRPATDVVAKLFLAALPDTGILPDLPADFWADFPDDAPGAASEWSAVAPHAVISEIEPGRARVAGFEWQVPADASSLNVVLAVISADNDAIAETERRVGILVPGSTKCALRVIEVDDP